MATVTAETADGQYLGNCAVTVSNILYEFAGKAQIRVLFIFKYDYTVEWQFFADYTVKMQFVCASQDAEYYNSYAEGTWSKNAGTGLPESVTIENNFMTHSTDTYAIVQNGNNLACTTFQYTTPDGTYKPQSTGVNQKMTAAIPPNSITASSIKFKSTSETIAIDNTKQLRAVFEPLNASDKYLTWESSNPSVVSVNENGVVTGISAGSATVTARTEDGGNKTAGATVTVKNPDEMLALSLSYGYNVRNESQSSAGAASIVSVLGNDTVKIKAYVSPVNVSNASVSWFSDNTAIATVDAAGNVHGVSPGRVMITATSVINSSVSAKCEVQIVNENTIENQYATHGGNDVSILRYDANTTEYNHSGLSIWYPSNITDTNEQYPVVVIVVGTGEDVTRYWNLNTLLASRGMIVIGTCSSHKGKNYRK